MLVLGTCQEKGERCGVKSVFILFSSLQRTKFFFLNAKQPKCKTAKKPNKTAEHQRSSFFQPGPLRCSSAARLSSASVVCCCTEVGPTSYLAAAWPTFSIPPTSLQHSDTYRKGTCVNRWEMQSVKDFNWLTECDIHGGGKMSESVINRHHFSRLGGPVAPER